MDFHSLKRRDLQALCKRNKIPANITNVAMADALAALDIVEGIEEFLNQSSVESPEKSVKASPCVPRTSGRKTSRRKPISEDAESVQISTRSCRRTRKAITEEGESAKIDVGGIVASGLHSRRSTRLLEKKMMELNMNDEERIKPIDFGADKEIANEIEGNVKKHSHDLGGVLEDQGLNQETISDVLPMKNDDLEDLLDKKSENAKELEQPSDNVLVSEQNAVGLTPEMGEDVNEVNYMNKGQNEDDDVVVGSEGYAKSDILSGENWDKSLELKASATIDQDETPGVRSNQKRVDLALSLQKMETPRNQKEEISIQKTYSCRSTRLSEKEMMELNLNDEDGMEPVDFGGSDKEMDNEIEVSGKEYTDDFGRIEVSGKEYSDDFGRISDVQGLNQETKSDDFLQTDDLVDLVDEKFGDLSDNARELEQPSEVPDKSEQNADDGGVGSVRCAQSDLLSGEYLEKEEALEKEAECWVPEKGEQGFNAKKDSGLKDIRGPVDDLVSEDSGQVEFYTLNLSVSAAAEDQKQDIELQDIIESDVMSVKDPEDESEHSFESTNIKLSNAMDCPPAADCQVTSNIGNLMTVDSSTISIPSDKISSAELPVDMPFSTLEADPLPDQMSSSLLQPNSDPVTCPASVTPRKKFSNKIPITSRKISTLLDENKENLDNSGRKLDLTKEKGKKEDSLNDKSMRQLTKMLKEKLQITSKVNTHEEKGIAKVGRARPALQSLSENRLVASEPGNQI